MHCCRVNEFISFCTSDTNMGKSKNGWIIRVYCEGQEAFPLTVWLKESLCNRGSLKKFTVRKFSMNSWLLLFYQLFDMEKVCQIVDCSGRFLLNSFSKQPDERSLTEVLMCVHFHYWKIFLILTGLQLRFHSFLIIQTSWLRILFIDSLFQSKA